MKTTRQEENVQDLKEVGLDCYRLEIEAECCTVSSCSKLQVGSHPYHGGVLQIVVKIMVV